MARRIPVILDLEAANYLAEAKAVKSETAAVDREMKDLDRSVDAVDRDMAELSMSMAVASNRVDDLGDDARSTAASLALLDARILATKANVRELGVEFARTGDIIDGKALAKEESLLRKLERLKKSLSDVVPGEAGGGGGMPAAGGAAGASGFGRMSVMNPYVLAGAGTALAVAGPALGAMLAGIIAGAIGTGGVAGGLLMAAKDPRTKSAAVQFGDAITKEFFRGGDAFVGPLQASLHILEQSFLDMRLPETFAKMAPHVTTIAQGFGELGENIMPGLNKAFDRMGPFADAAADGFSDMGYALGQFMDDVTASPGAVLGLRVAFDILNGTIIFIGKNIKFLSDAFAGLLTIGAAVGQSPVWKILTFGMSDDVARRWEHYVDELYKAQHGAAGVGDAADDGAEGVASFGEAADRAAEATLIFNEALSDSYDAFLDWTGAEIEAEEAIDRLQESFAENGDTMDVTTEAGRENLRNLKDLAEAALEAARVKYIETGSVEEANAVYDSYRQQLYDTFLGLTGNAEMAQILTDKWLALGKLEDLVKTFTINVSIPQAAAIDAYLSGNIPRGFQRASGGPVEAYGTYLVGEHEPEILQMGAQSGHVYTSQQWNGAMAGASGGGIDYAQLAAALQEAPILSYIEVGGEVVRVVDSRISSANRATARRVQAGSSR
jgi:hypothetical protein